MDKKILLGLISLLFILNSFSFFVSADEDTQFLLSDWDTVATGVHNGTSGYIQFDSEGDNIFTVSHTDYLSSPNSIKLTSSNGDHRQGVWILTSDFEYIGFINISFEDLWGTDATSGFYMNFTDYQGNEVIRMRMTDDDFAWFQAGTGWTNIDTTMSTDRQYLWITHNGTNFFNIKLLNDAFVVQTNKDYAGSYAGTYTNFSYINFTTWTDVGENFMCYFDNFYISTDSTGQFCSLSGLDSICTNTANEYFSVPATDTNPYKYIEHITENEYTNTIKAVILPISNDQYNLVSSTASDYEMTINGFNCGGADYIINFGTYYGVQWCDINGEDGVTIDNEKIVFGFRCNDFYSPNPTYDYYWYGIGGNLAGVGEATYHKFYYLYTNDQLDGTTLYGAGLSVCFYFEGGLNEIILDPDILQPYEDKFGNEFIQFYRYDIDCEYNVGDYPKIIYNLSDDNITDNNYNNPYMYKIYKVDIENSTYQFWTQGFIGMYQSYQSDIITVPKKLTEEGNYVIRLYNTTSAGASVDTLLFTSLPINVCPKEGGGGGTGFDTGTGWYGLPNWIPYLIGIFLTLFITMSPLIIGTYITRHSRIGKINIPPMLYVGFFYAGLIISVLMELLPLWLPFVILFSMIIYFAVQWLYGKKSDITGE